MRLRQSPRCSTEQVLDLLDDRSGLIDLEVVPGVVDGDEPLIPPAPY